ncbi:hypothetical protein BXZ70DRAFT_933920 [Cristinia sonorae]|uniref:Uncharacterized protein n=1 Tax=Cristinia sonorae TaxID=1940300 RepID=A0A8K0UR14_9AGAR|nr:hypothetical protein BXZ70DRAFT_933920 [Cristinia sonorae]
MISCTQCIRPQRPKPDYAPIEAQPILFSPMNSITATIPKPYLPVHDALRGAIARPPKLSTSEIIHVLQTLGANAANSSSHSALIRSVKDLNDRAIAIDASFASTEDLLTEIQAGTGVHIPSRAKEQLENVLAMYLMRHEDYIDIFWDTHPIVEKGRHVATELKDIVIPSLADSAVLKSDKLKAIARFQTFLKEEGADDAHKLHERVDALVAGFKTVVDRWQEIVTEHSLDVTSDTIQQFDNKLKSFDTTIGDLTKKMISLSSTLNVTSAFPTTCQNLSSFIPEWSDTMLLDAISKGVSGKVIQDIRTEQHDIYTGLSDTEHERSQDAHKLAKLQHLHASLYGEKRSVSHVCWQFKAAIGIWTSASSDLDVIKGKLNSSGEQEVLEEQLHAMRVLYSSLKTGLDEYLRLFTSTKPVKRR